MANHRALTVEQEEQAVSLNQEGYASTLIGRMLDVHPSTVKSTLKRRGISITRNGIRKYISKDDLNQAIDLYQKGWSLADIAQQLDQPWAMMRTHLERAGVSIRPGGFREGLDHHAWAGGRTHTVEGYVLVRIHAEDPFFSMAKKKDEGASYALEHRLVMARSLGRVLEDYETVHHKDGNHQNNNLDNLQLRSGRHGKGVVHKCRNCGSVDIDSVSL